MKGFFIKYISGYCYYKQQMVLYQSITGEACRYKKKVSHLYAMVVNNT